LLIAKSAYLPVFFIRVLFNTRKRAAAKIALENFLAALICLHDD